MKNIIFINIFFCKVVFIFSTLIILKGCVDDFDLRIIPTYNPNYSGKLAKDFLNLMSARYPFWKSPDYLEGDDFDKFKSYYEKNKINLSQSNFSSKKGKILLERWIKNLKGKHFNIKLIKSQDSIPKIKITKTPYLLYNFYDFFLEVFFFQDFQTLSKKKYKEAYFLSGFFSKKNILYLGISGFPFLEKTKSLNLDSSIYELLSPFIKKANGNPPPKGIIMDLRNNKGGSFFTTEFISSLFINNHSSFIVGCKKKRKNLNPKSQKGPWQEVRFTNVVEPLISDTIPIVILVDSHSASGAEWTAAILRQRNKVIIIGEKTQGAFSSYIPFEYMKKYFNFEKTYGGGGEFELKNDKGISIMIVTIGEGIYKLGKNQGEGEGIKPDKEIPMNDIIEPIKKAIELLVNGKAEAKKPTLINCFN